MRDLTKSNFVDTNKHSHGLLLAAHDLDTGATGLCFKLLWKIDLSGLGFAGFCGILWSVEELFC